jgi:predicted regulator of Ras-like GTPase activity (Roadblock/LC7/MglB family)
VDAAQALADLTEISSQIEAAVLFDESGAIEGSTLTDERAAEALARAAAELLEAAAAFPSGGGEVSQLEVSTHEGSVFVVRDGSRRIAATTVPQPTVGLVFYDLKSCLRGAGAQSEKPEPEKPRPRRTRKKADADAA